MAFIVALIAALLIAYMLYTILFRDWDEFIESWIFWLTPDLESLQRGELHEDLWAELKLLIWICGVIGTCISAYRDFG